MPEIGFKKGRRKKENKEKKEITFIPKIWYWSRWKLKDMWLQAGMY